MSGERNLKITFNKFSHNKLIISIYIFTLKCSRYSLKPFQIKRNNKSENNYPHNISLSMPQLKSCLLCKVIVSNTETKKFYTKNPVSEGKIE